MGVLGKPECFGKGYEECAEHGGCAYNEECWKKFVGKRKRGLENEFGQ